MKKLLFILFFIAALGFIIFLVAFLFTSLTVMFILFLICFLFSIIFILLFRFFDSLRMFFDKIKAKKYLRDRKTKEQELKDLETMFFKRAISEDTFIKTKNQIESEILELDSKIQIAQIKSTNTEQELKEKIRLLTKNYMSKRISEELFQELYTKYSRELAILTSKKISGDLDRKIKRELLKLKRAAKKKAKE